MSNSIRHKSFLFKGILYSLVVTFSLSTLAPLSAMAALALDQGVPPVQVPANSAALGLQNAFIDVAAKVSPAVVNISAEWTEDVQGFGGVDDFWNMWFYGQRGQRQSPVYKKKQRSLGSGFIVTSDGYIVTNAHVIGKAEKVTVTMADGTTYPGKIVGKYDRLDIGVIKITDGKTFPHVVFGNSEDIKVGQWAIAIGNPFALDHTVTTGVISAKGRSVDIGENGSQQSYIQTDASINPGNSGGPLCNIQGEVIGVNSAIYSRTGGSVGIGFAIPANIARKTAEDLVNNNGKIVRAGLGVIIQPLSPKMAKSFGLASNQGALISDVNPGSAAEKAGLKSGDIILSINGSAISDSGDLMSRLYSYRPGDTVTLSYQRNGKQAEASVVLQTLSEKPLKGEDQGDNGDNSLMKPGQGENQNLGLAYQDQTADIRGQLPAGAPKGPVIVQVERESSAAAAGLRPGDVVLKVGDSPVYSANQLTVLLKKADLKSGVRLHIWREGQTFYTILQSGGE